MAAIAFCFPPWRRRFGPGRTSQIVEGGSVPLSTWTHIACASDGATITLFVDGAQVDQLTPSGAGTLDTSSSLNVGFGVNATGISTSANAWLDGRLDHVMLFTGERRSDQEFCLAAGGSATACN